MQCISTSSSILCCSGLLYTFWPKIQTSIVLPKIFSLKPFILTVFRGFSHEEDFSQKSSLYLVSSCSLMLWNFMPSFREKHRRMNGRTSGQHYAASVGPISIETVIRNLISTNWVRWSQPHLYSSNLNPPPLEHFVTFWNPTILYHTYLWSGRYRWQNKTLKWVLWPPKTTFKIRGPSHGTSHTFLWKNYWAFNFWRI